MPRSNTGQNQEASQLAANQAQAAKDAAAVDTSVTNAEGLVANETGSINQSQQDVNNMAGSIAGVQGSVDKQQGSVNNQQGAVNNQQGAVNQEQSDVNALTQTPGYTDDEIAKMKTGVAGQVNADFGGASTQAASAAAQQGGNSAGLASNLTQNAQQEALGEETGSLNVDQTAATAAMKGRAAIPGLQAGVVSGQGQVVQGQGAVTQGQAGVTQGAGQVVGENAAVAGEQNAITGAEANQANQTLAPANIYQSGSNALTGDNTSLINTQQNIDAQPTFWQKAALGAIQAGGAVGAAAVKCWIAAELFGGWEDPRTILMREWLWNDYNRTPFGALVVRAYEMFGAAVARAIRKPGVLRSFFKQIFEAGLRRARRWESRQREAK
jgi:hypothetical protein